MPYVEGNDKHLVTLKEIEKYAKPVEQKNLTTVNIEHASRNTKLMLAIMPQWAAEFPPFNLCRLSAVARQAGYESRVIDGNIRAYRYYEKYVADKLDYKLWDPTTIWRWTPGNYDEIHKHIEPVMHELRREIIEYNPTIIGFTVYQMNEEPTKWMIQELKKCLPN